MIAPGRGLRSGSSFHSHSSRPHWSGRSSPTGPIDHLALRSKITSSSGASFSCSASTGSSLSSNRELLERVRSVEVDLAAQENRSEVDGREATRSLANFEDDLAGLRA